MLTRDTFKLFTVICIKVVLFIYIIITKNIPRWMSIF